ncbi:MAG: IrmA family protein [Alcaligenes sp.]
MHYRQFRCAWNGFLEWFCVGNRVSKLQNYRLAIFLCIRALGLYRKRESDVVFRKYVKLASAVVLMSGLISGPAQAIQMWHSDTVWANQGMCAANFTFDSGLDRVQQLKVHIRVLDKKTNNVVAQDVIELDEFGGSNADRYATGYWHSGIACDEDLRLLVTQASAVIEGVHVDLLAKRELEIRPFVPYEITIQAPRAAQSQHPDACQTSKFNVQAVIQDKDGYSNVRAQPNAKSDVIEKLFEKDVFFTFEQKGNWWQVCTPTGQIGYLYHDRIRPQY